MHEIDVKIPRKNHLQNKHGQDARATGCDGFFVLWASCPRAFFPLFSACQLRGLIVCI
jgi:hypothetical protein